MRTLSAAGWSPWSAPAEVTGVNLPEVLMGVAAGIGILAALTHGLVGFARRPRDRARIAFAVAAAAAAAGALSVLALYTITDIDLHIAVMKWAFFPATVIWTLAIVWFAAFFADVRPRWFLYALSAGFALTLVINAVLPRGILHQQRGGLMEMDTLGGSVMVMTQSQPHALQNITDALTLIAFAFLCYAVYRVFRRPSQRASLVAGADDGPAGRRDPVRRDHRAPRGHHLQQPLPLTGELRSGDHRRQPGAAR